jgi:hypothetical protein
MSKRGDQLRVGVDGRPSPNRTDPNLAPAGLGDVLVRLGGVGETLGETPRQTEARSSSCSRVIPIMHQDGELQL